MKNSTRQEEMHSLMQKYEEHPLQITFDQMQEVLNAAAIDALDRNRRCVRRRQGIVPHRGKSQERGKHGNE